MKFELSLQISEKHSNITFYEVCPVGAKLFHVDGRTVGQKNRRIGRNDEAKIRFS
jgi:hypothetical protein